MSFITIQMADTFPEGDLLDAFDELETKTISSFAELVYVAYHRGRRQQIIRCMAQYMYREGKTYEVTRKLFHDPLIQGENLRDAVEKYLVIYAAIQQNIECSPSEQD